MQLKDELRKDDPIYIFVLCIDGTDYYARRDYNPWGFWEFVHITPYGDPRQQRKELRGQKFLTERDLIEYVKKTFQNYKSKKKKRGRRKT